LPVGKAVYEQMSAEDNDRGKVQGYVRGKTRAALFYLLRARQRV